MNDKPKILVVDDEEIVCKSCQRILEGAYDVSIAMSGQSALQRIKEEEFDVVLIDLIMPGIDGMDVIKNARKSRPDIMMIVITGYATDETEGKAMEEGAYEYIPKPFTPEEILAVVKKALDKRKLIKETEMPPR